MTIEIANRLAQLRREQGLSQEELASRLGVSRQAVSKWERAESSPDTGNLIALARLYDISLDALLLHGQVAQAPPPPEADPDAAEQERLFAAAQAWEEAEEARAKKRRKALREGLNWLATLALMGLLPLLSLFLGAEAAYPLLVVFAYLVTGFLLDNWHPGWLLFLTIPLYYLL